MSNIYNSYYRGTKVVYLTWFSLGDAISGHYHRIDGPAIIKYYLSGKIESHTYYCNNKLHRVGGAAHESFFEDGHLKQSQFWVDGKKYLDYSQYLRACKLFNIS